MLSPAQQAFVEPGWALLVGTVDSDGRPFATRGWGCEFIDDAQSLRTLIHRAEAAVMQVGNHVAATGAHVHTLRSAQLKGVITSVEPIVDSERDLEIVREYCDSYYETVEKYDGFARSLMDRVTPSEFAAFTFTIEETYDQTPGPKAGHVVK